MAMSEKIKSLLAYFRKKKYVVKKDTIGRGKSSSMIVYIENGRQYVRLIIKDSIIFLSRVNGKMLDENILAYHGMVYQREYISDTYYSDEEGSPVYITDTDAKEFVTYVMDGRDRYIEDMQRFYAQNPYADQPNAVPVSGRAMKISNRKQRVIVNESKPKKKTLKMNKFFKAREAARKAGKKSFTYNGSTYVAKKTKTGMTIYKKK